LKSLLAGVAAISLPRVARAAGPYRVGVGSSPDPYDATLRAIAASGEWPAARIAGRHVVIKTNLVLGGTAESGGTTSPQTVRALVDRALAANASKVSIVEGGRRGAPFGQCGYDFLRSYDALGRIALVDLNFDAPTVANVPAGLTYRRLYMPQIAVNPDIVFISAAKLKVHVETGVTLSLKNLFGLPPILPYFDATQAEFRSRYVLHDRGVHQAIVDLALVRPIDFSVVDGGWGMEGESPSDGTPVRMDLAVAGSNALAVDRVCSAIMSTPQERAQHFTYAALRGLGPASLDEVSVVGDSFTPHPFLQPRIPPQVWYPRTTPSVFAPGRGDRTTITYRLLEPALVRVQVLRTTDVTPSIAVVRTLRDWSMIPAAGVEALVWDGRDDAGALVAAGTYAVRVQAFLDGVTLFNAGTGWVAAI